MEEEIKLCDGVCYKCRYSGQIHGGGNLFCAYILITKRCRPCPAGEGCTVRVVGKRIELTEPMAVMT